MSQKWLNHIVVYKNVGNDQLMCIFACLRWDLILRVMFDLFDQLQVIDLEEHEADEMWSERKREKM